MPSWEEILRNFIVSSSGWIDTLEANSTMDKENVLEPSMNKYRNKAFRKSPLLSFYFLLLFFLSKGSFLFATVEFAPTSSPCHVYMDAKIIMTLELTAKKEFWVELVNIGDMRRCLSIENITMRADDGTILRFDSFLYDGAKSKTDGGVRACVTARTRRRWELGYGFVCPQAVRKVVFLIGSQAFRLQPMSPSEFEEFSKNLDKINLDVGSEYLKIFDMRVKFGRNNYGSTVRYRRVNVPPTSEGSRGPITLLSTTPPQTEQALKKKKGGEVEISVKLNEKGEVIEAKPENTLEFGLTERALYEVKNWWEFAPAFESGKPVASNHTVKVVYRIEEKEEED